MKDYTVTAHVYLTVSVRAEDETSAGALAEQELDQAVDGSGVDPGKFEVLAVECDEGDGGGT